MMSLNRRAAVDPDAAAIAAVEQQIREAMQEGGGGSDEAHAQPQKKQPTPVIAEPEPEDTPEHDKQAEEEDNQEEEDEDEAMDAVACAGRRLVAALPRPSAAAARGRPSLLLRIPYPALLAVWQQLPRA
eukprot:COSAG06_NODE_12810_length_1325_cov_48.132137_3_plen_128_part_01